MEYELVSNPLGKPHKDVTFVAVLIEEIVKVKGSHA
jgi:hypothetical protein